MMSVEKMAKVVSEINRGLASSRTTGSRWHFQDPYQLRSNLCVYVCVVVGVPICDCINTHAVICKY